MFASLAYMASVKYQLKKLSRGEAPNPNISPLRALLIQQFSTAISTRKYRRLMAQRAA